MTKHPLLSTLFITILLISVQACTDSGEDFNHAELYDSRETVDFHEDQELNMVSSLELMRDGSYERSITFRDPETDALVGYYHFQEGNISINGNTISFQPFKDLFIGCAGDCYTGVNIYRIEAL
ncbi:MAG: hypothetical protein WD431_23615 [Cyclobacteriaceae bacterium]